MPRLTVFYGVLMIVLGVVGYTAGVYGWFGTTSASPTALIPAFFGVVFALLGFAAMVQPDLRKHLMHAAAALGVLAILAPIGRLVPLAVRGTLVSNFGTLTLVLMMLLSIGFVAACVKLFIDARKARLAA